jgi:hypothetical protein
MYGSQQKGKEHLPRVWSSPGDLAGEAIAALLEEEALDRVDEEVLA